MLVNTNRLTFTAALHNLTKQELEFRDKRAQKINITVSLFPYVKTVDVFTFNYQPFVNKNLRYDLKSLRFMSEDKNIIFMGSHTWYRKTHLAISIGIEAASQRIDAVIKHYLKYSLLIIDKIGYLPIDRDTSYVFFQLIVAKYEKRLTLITTNQPSQNRAMSLKIMEL